MIYLVLVVAGAVSTPRFGSLWRILRAWSCFSVIKKKKMFRSVFSSFHCCFFFVFLFLFLFFVFVFVFFVFFGWVDINNTLIYAVLVVADAVCTLRFRSPWRILRVWPWKVPNNFVYSSTKKHLTKVHRMYTNKNSHP